MPCLDAEMKKFIDRGTFVQLSTSEMQEYAGPVIYITHHGFFKDSASTPLRVVTNSPKKNGKYNLNDLMPKGPNSLNDMLAVLLRFRVYDKVFAFDLSKAYNTMRTSVQERHLRRFVWRWTEDCPWIDLGIDRVHFGDIGAASELQVSKGFVADLGALMRRHLRSLLRILMWMIHLLVVMLKQWKEWLVKRMNQKSLIEQFKRFSVLVSMR